MFSLLGIGVGAEGTRLPEGAVRQNPCVQASDLLSQLYLIGCMGPTVIFFDASAPSRSMTTSCWPTARVVDFGAAPRIRPSTVTVAPIGRELKLTSMSGRTATRPRLMQSSREP